MRDNGEQHFEEHFENVSDTFLGLTKVKFVGIIALLVTVGLNFVVFLFAQHLSETSQRSSLNTELLSVFCRNTPSLLAGTTSEIAYLKSLKHLDAHQTVQLKVLEASLPGWAERTAACKRFPNGL